LCTYFLTTNDKVEENFVHVLKYQKEKIFCSKYYVTGFYKENKFWSINFQNENTEKGFFGFEKILSEIRGEIMLLDKLFPDLLNDPFKDKIPKETTVYQIYHETTQILKEFKEKEKQNENLVFIDNKTIKIGLHETFEEQESIESFLENEKGEIKKVNAGSTQKDIRKKKETKKIKIKGKILNVPAIWGRYKIKCWGDFETYVKNDVEEFLSTENINQTTLCLALKNIKLSSLILGEEDLDLGETNYVNFFGRVVDEIWNLVKTYREKTIKIKGKEFKIPSCWDDYNLYNFLGFEEAVKTGMLRQFAKTKKLTPNLIEIVEKIDLESSITSNEELDLNSEEHIYLVKRKMVESLLMCNEL